MNIKGALPTSFLFSWEGNLAIKSHTVEPVDEAIRRYFGETHYKVVVEPVEVYGDKYAISSNPDWVRDEVIKQLGSRSKFDVVGKGATHAEVQSSEICKTEFPPNSTLKIKIQGFGSGERVLSLELQKDGCVKGKSTKTYRGSGLEEDRESLRQAVEHGVTEILGQLLHNRIKKPQLIGSGKPREGKIGVISAEENENYGNEEIVMSFESDPPGGVVMLDGSLLCSKTPCSKMVTVGRHEVTIQAENYVIRRENIEAKKGLKISWNLAPDFGLLSVISEPPGLEVKIDGAPIGKSPISDYRVSPKLHEVLVVSDCYYEAGERLVAESGKRFAINVTPVPRTGKIIIVAHDNNGNDIEADVFIGGNNIGKAPGVFSANICVKEIEIRNAAYGKASKNIAIIENQLVKVDLTIHGFGNGMWKDPSTGLLWQNPPAERVMDWEEAISYCKHLDLDGYTDWWLPSIEELQSLLRNDSKGCKWPDEITGDCKKVIYWSATYHTGKPAGYYPMVISFNSGEFGDSLYDLSKVTTRCVRGDIRDLKKYQGCSLYQIKL
jgi:hypothetical protein